MLKALLITIPALLNSNISAVQPQPLGHTWSLLQLSNSRSPATTALLCTKQLTCRTYVTAFTVTVPKKSKCLFAHILSHCVGCLRGVLRCGGRGVILVVDGVRRWNVATESSVAENYPNPSFLFPTSNPGTRSFDVTKLLHNQEVVWISENSTSLILPARFP